MDDKARHIETIACSWIGTRFRLYGRTKASKNDAGGCDCIGLIIEVAAALELPGQAMIKERDHTNYNFHNNGLLLENFLEDNFYPTDECQPGLIALFQITDNLQHVGILSTYGREQLGLIHADIRARKIVEHYFGDEFKTKLKGLYKFSRIMRANKKGR